MADPASAARHAGGRLGPYRSQARELAARLDQLPMEGDPSRISTFVRVVGGLAALMAVADAATLAWLGYVLSGAAKNSDGNAIGAAVLTVIGFLLLPFGAVLALVALGATFLFYRGERWALLAGATCAPGLLWVGYAMRTATGSAQILELGSVVAGAVLAGAALGHVAELVSNRPLFGRRTLTGRGSKWGMVCSIVLSFLWVAQRFPRKSIDDAETAAASVHRPTIAERPVAIGPRAPEWSGQDSDVIALAVQGHGEHAATLHRSGRVVLWGPPQGSPPTMDYFENASSKLFEWRTTIGARWVRVVDRLVVVGGGAEIETFAPGGGSTVTEVCPLRGEVFVENLGRGRLALGADVLCSVSFLDGVSAMTIPLAGTGCSRIEGIDASLDGAEIALQCDRRVVVLDGRTWKAKGGVRTPKLVPGSVRLLPERLLGVTHIGTGYSYVVLPRTGDGRKPLVSVDLGDSAAPPRVWADAASRKILVAGNGVCRVEPDTGKEIRCLVPRTELVREIAFPPSWTKLEGRGVSPGRPPFRGDLPSGCGLALVESRQVMRLTELRDRW